MKAQTIPSADLSEDANNKMETTILIPLCHCHYSLHYVLIYYCISLQFGKLYTLAIRDR